MLKQNFTVCPYEVNCCHGCTEWRRISLPISLSTSHDQAICLTNHSPVSCYNLLAPLFKSQFFSIALSSFCCCVCHVIAYSLYGSCLIYIVHVDGSCVHPFVCFVRAFHNKMPALASASTGISIYWLWSYANYRLYLSVLLYIESATERLKRSFKDCIHKETTKIVLFCCCF